LFLLIFSLVAFVDLSERMLPEIRFDPSSRVSFFLGPLLRDSSGCGFFIYPSLGLHFHLFFLLSETARVFFLSAEQALFLVLSETFLGFFGNGFFPSKHSPPPRRVAGILPIESQSPSWPFFSGTSVCIKSGTRVPSLLGSTGFLFCLRFPPKALLDPNGLTNPRFPRF